MKNKNVIKVDTELLDIRQKLFHKKNYVFYKTQLSEVKQEELRKAKITLKTKLGRDLTTREQLKLTKIAKAEQEAEKVSKKVIDLGFEDDTGVLKSNIISNLATAKLSKTIETQTTRFKKIKFGTLSREIKQSRLNEKDLIVSAKNEMISKWISAFRESTSFSDSDINRLTKAMNDLTPTQLYNKLKGWSYESAHLLFESDPNEITLSETRVFSDSVASDINYIIDVILGNKSAEEYMEEYNG